MFEIVSMRRTRSWTAACASASTVIKNVQAYLGYQIHKPVNQTRELYVNTPILLYRFILVRARAADRADKQ